MQPTGSQPGGAKIALVDDDPRIRWLLAAEIVDLGHEPICYDNPFNLLQELDTKTPALVILDLMMPQMDGMECVRRLRQNSFKGAVILFTAMNDYAKRQEAALEGATDYILKPDLFENLETILARYL